MGRVRCHRRQGRNERGQGGAITRGPSHYGGAKSLRGAPKSPTNVTSTSFNTVHLLPKELRFEHGGRQTCFLPRAPSNLVAPLITTQSLLPAAPNCFVLLRNRRVRLLSFAARSSASARWKSGFTSQQ